MDVAGISESWFTSRKLEEHFQIDDYVLKTKNRTQKKEAGGVAIYVRENLGAQIFENIEVPDHLEVLWVRARPQSGVSMLFYAIMYSPSKDRYQGELINH